VVADSPASDPGIRLSHSRLVQTRLGQTLLIVAVVLALRLPFLNQAIQGDDVYYLAGAEYAQTNPLHPTHARYVFQGELLDMRGHPHPPLNVWVLAGLIAVVGDVKEIPFHLAYTAFSLIAALSTLSLARRFCRRPLLATLLFLAVPAFVINGNSLEADLPFLAFWMASIALFVEAVDRESGTMLAASGFAAVLTAMAAYQAILLTPILAVYLLRQTKRSIAAWSVVIAAPAALVVWQAYERISSGTLPAAVLAGYMQTYGLETLTPKLHSAGALIAHSGWIVSPLIILVAFLHGPSPRPKWKWIVASIAGAAAALYDPNPIFWASFGCGVLMLLSFGELAQNGVRRETVPAGGARRTLCASCGRDFLRAWITIFFTGALILFFAGSARYLLPIAAPVAILAANAVDTRIGAIGFALQMALSLALAVVNYQTWDGYRQFAAAQATDVAGHRTWINGEWGLRYYFESEGGIPLERKQQLQPGDRLIASAWAIPLPVTAPLAPLAQVEIRPAIPLRIFSLDGHSGYSSANRGLRPFEFSSGIIDVVRAGTVVDRTPQLSFVDPRDPQAASQMISGLYPDGWMDGRATVLLKRPDPSVPLQATFYIPPASPARHISLMVDGQVVTEQTFATSGSYTMTGTPAPKSPSGPAIVTVTLVADKTFSAPPDVRKLAMIVTGIGFKP